MDNPIGTTLLHVLTDEDRLIQSVFQGKPSFWKADRWYEQIGVISLPFPGHDWSTVNLTSLQTPALFADAQVVEQATADYLHLLTNTDLEEQVEVYGYEFLTLWSSSRASGIPIWFQETLVCRG